MCRHLIGIDEAGRGPLAGPVAVGIVCIPTDKRKPSLLKEARDSKKISETKREIIFKKAVDLKKEGQISFTVSMVHADTIYRIGITRAIRLCITRGLKRMNVDPKETQVLLDGSLKAPNEFEYQKTIIKGDQKEKIISLASILAKVTRDRLMKRMVKKYPGYDFDIHKGYGTAKHLASIKKNGITPIHRKTFCK